MSLTEADTGPEIRAGGGPAVLAAAVTVTLAAAAWALLASGLTGPMSHRALLGEGPVPALPAVLSFLGNWQLMIVATMLPPSIPAVMNHVRGAPRWRAGAAVVASICVVWTAFGVVVLVGDAGVHRLVSASPWLEQREWLVTSAVLTLAGVVELSQWHRRPTATTGARPGQPWRYAMSCLGRCWPLMLVMFAVALENLLGMAMLAAMMTAQRIPGFGRRLMPVVGFALFGAATLLPLRPGGR